MSTELKPLTVITPVHTELKHELLERVMELIKHRDSRVVTYRVTEEWNLRESVEVVFEGFRLEVTLTTIK